MTRLIDADALLEKFAKLEAIALEYVGKLNERQDPNEHDMWVMWTGILNERTAYKYEIVDAPTIDSEPKWIPCSKEMPDEYEPVLTYTNRGDIRIMEYGVEWNGFMWKDEADYLHDIDFAQAWMPLPERYKVEE